MAIVQNNDPRVQPSFSIANRMGRMLWGIVWITLFRFTPRPLHAWRSFLLKAFGAKIGRQVHIYAGVKIWAPWNLVIGDHVGIGDGATLYSMDVITIQDNAVISQGAHLCAGSHDIDSDNFQLIAAPITIKPYCWVCAEAFVGPGVILEEGCVVGARGVVMRSITQPWTVWSGNPVSYRKKRKSSIK